jgi:hypothetical protein
VEEGDVAGGVAERGREEDDRMRDQQGDGEGMVEEGSWEDEVDGSMYGVDDDESTETEGEQRERADEEGLEYISRFVQPLLHQRVPLVLHPLPHSQHHYVSVLPCRPHPIYLLLRRLKKREKRRGKEEGERSGE